MEKAFCFTSISTVGFMFFILLACLDANFEKDSLDTLKEETGQDSGLITEDTDAANLDSGSIEPLEPCPVGMALIQEQFCMDIFEASVEVFGTNSWEDHSPFHTPSGNNFRSASQKDVVPQAHISGESAQTACQNSGKRLCTSEEWLLACQGQEGRIFPYGMTYLSGACNDTYTDGHPLIHYFGTSEGIWDSTHMNDPNINQQPNSLAKTGSFADCVTPEGIHDLHGNLHEWIADESGIFRGGFYADASINGTGCSYKTSAHNFRYFDYSTGFRCCAERVE